MQPKYLKMLKGMQAAQAAAPASREWSVYMLSCGDGSIYTGIAKDVDKRLQQHNNGKGAAYTRARRPVRLVYRVDGMTRSEALVREAQIKRFPRSQKQTLWQGD